MSTKIELYFKRSLDLDLLEKGIKAYLVRLIVKMQFKIDKNWSKPYEAIVDTGAPISILSLSLWKKIDVDILGEHAISGIVPKKECSLAVKVERLTCRLIDTKSVTKDLEILAYLSPTDKVPLILGFERLLIKADVSFNYEKGRGYCEIE